MRRSQAPSLANCNLFALSGANNSKPLRPESESSFFGEREATYVFVRDDKGRVSEMIYDYGFMKLSAKKIK